MNLQNDINFRIRGIRSALKLNQIEFGEKISVSQTYLSQIEKGDKPVTDKIFKLICFQFDVNEEWLRDGVGEPFNEMLEEDELAAYCGQICTGKDPFIAGAILEYMRLDNSSKQVIKELVKTIVHKY